MPIYRYKCASCVIEFEKIMAMRMAESTKNRLTSEVECPECGCQDVTPLISRTSFALKGKGWYKDGYTKEHQ